MPLFTNERNCKITSVVKLTPSKSGSFPQGVFKVRITKPCTQLHQAPSTSTQLHPVPSASTQLIWASTQLSATPSTIFEPKHLCNWTISPNLGWKIQSCPFWLKIGSHGILEVPIPNPDLDFWNFNPKIHFWANLGSKSQSCRFCLKISTHGISRMLILITTLIF